METFREETPLDSVGIHKRVGEIGEHSLEGAKKIEELILKAAESARLSRFMLWEASEIIFQKENSSKANEADVEEIRVLGEQLAKIENSLKGVSYSWGDTASYRAIKSE